MKLIRWLVNFLAGAIAAFVSLYLVIAICILFFKLTGQLSDGPMYFDMQTPSYGGLFLFQAFSIAIISACLAVRITFGQKDDLAFLRKIRNVKSWNKYNLTEYLRPWKLITLAIGIALLIIGSFYYKAPDWDIPISLIMAFFTYLTASWSMHVVVERQWKKFPLMLLYTWFSIDGCYWVYWHFTDPVALELMRDANFFASLSLYGMCGLVWYYEGTVKQFISEAKAFVLGIRTN